MVFIILNISVYWIGYNVYMFRVTHTPQHVTTAHSGKVVQPYSYNKTNEMH
jgi:hypothetical protein